MAHLFSSAGIGWERQGDSPALPGQPIKGLVSFTFNGKRLPATLEDVAGGMWPVVHIQKKANSSLSNACLEAQEIIAM